LRALFSIDGPVYRFGEQVFDIIAISVLWIICCIPIVTIGSATCALYYVSVKQIRKNNGSLLSNFFGSFRDSLRTGIPLTSITLIYATAVAAVIWGLNGMAGNGSTGYLSYAAIGLLLPLLLVLPYLWPVVSRFSIKIGDTLTLCFIMSIRFFWRTVLTLLVMAGSAALLWFIPQCAIALPGLCALVCSFLLEPVLREYTPKPADGEPLPWYLD
jgi:uncharacterized membrane protein YesL